MSTSRPGSSGAHDGAAADAADDLHPRPEPHALLPSPFPHEASPDPALESDDARPAFTPFFTLIEDTSTSTHRHPAVHYIFSDDDPDLITQASLRALSPPSSAASASSLQNTKPGESAIDDSSEASASAQQPSRNRNAQERYVVVDVGPGGDTIAAARSLTADWQVLGVDVTSAPTWERETGPVEERDNALMLRIEGAEMLGSGGAAEDHDDDEDEDDERRGEGSAEDMQELLTLFEQRMAMLRKVVQTSEQSARVQ